MHEPKNEQKPRIEMLSKWVTENIPEIWEFEQRQTQNSQLNFIPNIASDQEHQRLYQHTFEQLAALFTEKELSKHLIDYYLFPISRASQHSSPEVPYAKAARKCFYTCLNNVFGGWG